MKEKSAFKLITLFRQEGYILIRPPFVTALNRYQTKRVKTKGNMQLKKDSDNVVLLCTVCFTSRTTWEAAIDRIFAASGNACPYSKVATMNKNCKARCSKRLQNSLQPGGLSHEIYTDSDNLKVRWINEKC